MKRSKVALLLLAAAIVGSLAWAWGPIYFWVVARPATTTEAQSLLREPWNVLSPTGWHATPSSASGYVHRWRESTPVGQWDGYFKTPIAEGWARARFDLEGTLIGHSFFDANGRVIDQWKWSSGSWQTKKSPPWWWDEQDREILGSTN
ncbi:MAG: hypothetical protein AAF581_08820 [Planctomycetota bacterium]